MNPRVNRQAMMQMRENRALCTLFCFKYPAPCWQPRCHSYLSFRPVALRPRLSAGLPRSAICNMPKQFKRHNPGISRMGDAPVRNSRSVQSVKALLSRSSHSALGRVAEQRQTQLDWRRWLSSKLPAALDAHVSGVVERDENLVIFAESSAWSARLRFAVVELDKEIRAEKSAIRSVTVKVMPRGGVAKM